MSAIYSGHSCNFLQPRAQFTRRGGRTFSELHGVDHATTIRAIADIWFPRSCEFENRANGMSEIEGKVTRVGASERGQRASFNPTKGDEASSIAHQTSSMSGSWLLL